MPFLLPILADIPFILEGALGTAGGLATTAGLAGLASSGVGLAKTLSGTGAPQTPQLPTPTPPNPNQLLQQRELAGSQASNLESATSGAAGPDFLALFAPYLAGIQGQPGANAAGQYAANQNWSPTNAGPTNPATGQINLSDFINTSAGG